MQGAPCSNSATSRPPSRPNSAGRPGYCGPGGFASAGAGAEPGAGGAGCGCAGAGGVVSEFFGCGNWGVAGVAGGAEGAGMFGFSGVGAGVAPAAGAGEGAGVGSIFTPAGAPDGGAGAGGGVGRGAPPVCRPAGFRISSSSVPASIAKGFPRKRCSTSSRMRRASSSLPCAVRMRAWLTRPSGAKALPAWAFTND